MRLVGSSSFASDTLEIQVRRVFRISSFFMNLVQITERILLNSAQAMESI
jgi:hypothetical protein